MNIVVLLDCIERSIFVLEQTTLAVRTEESIGEGGADLGLVLCVVGREGLS